MDTAFEITLFPSKKFIPIATAALREYAALYFEEKKQVDKLILALEEAIGNVMFFSGTEEPEDLCIRAGVDGLSFCIEVSDKGMPGNFDQTLQGDDALGLALIRNSVDKYSIENLGAAGRRQKMVKYLASTPEAVTAELGTETPPVNASAMHFIIRDPRMEDLIEVSRGIYREYGWGYYHDTAYIPELYFEAITQGKYRSIVAVNENGEFAGHHAFWQWSDLPGVYESGMAVVNSRMRGAGIFNMMMENTRAYYLNNIARGVYLAYATTYHDFSQKTRLKYGSFPCGYAFNFSPADICAVNKDASSGSHSYALACEIVDKSEKTVYLPPETVDVARFIYDGLSLPRRIITEGHEAEDSTSSISSVFINRIRAGHICALELGADADTVLNENVISMRRQNAEMMELFINGSVPAAIPFYESAKRLGFFFAGIVPNSGVGDLIYMNKLVTGVINYDNICTCGPFTTLLAMLRTFDPDQQQ